MSYKTLCRNLEFSKDGSKCREGSSGKWCRVGTTLDETFGPSRLSTWVRTGQIKSEDVAPMSQFIIGKSRKLREEYNKTAESESDMVTESLIKSLGKSVILREINTQEDSCYFAYNPDTQQQIAESVNGVFRTLVSKGRKAEVEALKATAIPVSRTFNPNLPSGLITPDNSGQTFNLLNLFNTYVPIDWNKIEEAPLKDYQCFIDLIEFLIPDDYQRRLLFSWMTYAETGKNEHALLICGEKGVGKTFAIEAFCYFIGYQYSYHAKKDIVGSKFNSELSDVLLLVIEEAEMAKPSQKNAFKALMNPLTSIEQKGENIKKNVQSFLNIILTTNEEDDILVECDDRRFQVIDTVDEKPPVSVTAACDKVLKELRNKVSVSKNYGIIKGLKSYINSNTLPNYKHYTPDLTGKTFWSMVKANFNTKEQFVFDYAKKHAGEVVTFDAMKKAWDKKYNYRFPSDRTIRRLCKHYMPEGNPVLEHLDGIGVKYLAEPKEKPFQEE